MSTDATAIDNNGRRHFLIGVGVVTAGAAVGKLYGQTIIEKLGGKAVIARANYNFPVDQLKSQTDVLKFAAKLEQGAVSAYLGAVPLFANRDLAKAAASILGDEAMHWAILRNALGEVPVPSAFMS